MLSCAECIKPILRKEKSVQCCACLMVFHLSLSCAQSTENDLEYLKKEHKLHEWKCVKCITKRRVSQIGSHNEAIKQTIETSPTAQIKTATETLSETSCETVNIQQVIIQLFQQQEKTLEKKFGELNKQISDYKNAVDFCCNQLDIVNQELNNLRDNNKRQNKDIVMLKGEIRNLNEIVEQQTEDFNEINQRMRKNNLEISGIPETQGEDILFLLEKLAACLNVPFQQTDVERAHRINTYNKNIIKPIVVKFISYQHKLLWQDAYKRKKSESKLNAADLAFKTFSENQIIYVNDHLTPTNKKKLREAKDIAKIHGFKYVWWTGTSILLRKDDNSKPYKFMSEAFIKIINQRLTNSPSTPTKKSLHEN